MYYDLERNISKSTLSYDRQERLAKQLVDLIDRKMKERAPTQQLNSSLESEQISKKLMTGYAITANSKHERVPSIPCNRLLLIIVS